jgi:hypothetical protein
MGKRLLPSSDVNSNNFSGIPYRTTTEITINQATFSLGLFNNYTLLWLLLPILPLFKPKPHVCTREDGLECLLCLFPWQACVLIWRIRAWPDLTCGLLELDL